ncbi:MAG: hypothetical protein ACFFB0_13870 [Promethearchaeota archaeon]
MALLSEFCQIYILHFNEIKGLIPILIFSNEFIEKNENQIRPIKFHPIWFLNSENLRGFEQVNLVYNEKVYFAKKFKIFLERKKRKPRIKEENFDKIVIIIVLPREFDIYGSDLLNILMKTVKKNFSPSLNQIIESEILKENLIISPKIKEIIKRADIVKENIRNNLIKICENYFNSLKYPYEKNELNFLFKQKV